MPPTLNSYWSTKMDNVKEYLQPIIMKGFERRQIKKSLSLPLLHLSSSIFSSVGLTFACVLCCAALVLLLCVALTYISRNTTKLSKCKIYKHEKYLILVGVRGKFNFLHDIRSICTYLIALPVLAWFHSTRCYISVIAKNTSKKRE